MFGGLKMAPVTVDIPVSKVILDVVLLMCVGFPILFLFLWGSAYQRGFFCDDDSIRHPFHDSTVPSIYLYIVGIVLNCLVMILIEYLNPPKTTKQIKVGGITIPNWVYNSYCIIGIFAFGAACSQLSTDIMKYTVGRLRPHFYTICVPNVDCSAPINWHRYITDFKCTNSDYLASHRLSKESRLSFPSGHSSFSMYAMVFFAIYLQKRMTWDGSKLLKHTLQFLGIICAIFTAMTRISDYKHHWSDVLSGLLLGGVVAVITVTCFSTLFTSQKSKISSSDSSEMGNINGNRAIL